LVKKGKQRPTGGFEVEKRLNPVQHFVDLGMSGPGFR